MNNELFRPRGLYCLVMAYDMNSRREGALQDFETDTSALVPDATRPQGMRHRIRSNDGIGKAAEFPASAELVYPNSDDALSDSDDEQDSDSEAKGIGSSFTSKLGKFAADLNAKRDLKSQVKFVSDKPYYLSCNSLYLLGLVINQYAIIQQKKNPTSAINSLLDPQAELTAKDREKQDKREAKQDRKREKEERKAEKRQRKHPDKAPKERKIKPVCRRVI